MKRHAFLALVLVALVTCVWLSPHSSAGGESECVVIDDFSKAKVGQFPSGWKVRKDAGKQVYSVQEDGGRRFLRAVSRGLGIQAAKEYEWDPNVYPVLTWAWRPQQFPEGSDERHSKTNDSALAVYGVWPHSSVTVKTLKYIWSAVVPVGTHLTSSRGLTQVRVLKSGDAKGEWVEERIKVGEDYKRFFGEGEVPKAAGIAVLTDADDTRSVARGDYADFRICKG